MTVAGRDLEPEQRVDADADDDVVDHGDNRRNAIRHSKRTDRHADQTRNMTSAVAPLSSDLHPRWRSPTTR